MLAGWDLSSPHVNRRHSNFVLRLQLYLRRNERPQVGGQLSVTQSRWW